MTAGNNKVNGVPVIVHMKTIFHLIFLVLLVSCRQVPYQPPAVKTADKGIIAPDTSFNAYLAHFKLQHFPYTFDTDSSLTLGNYYFGTGNDLTDSNGHSLTELLLPRYLAEKWLSDTTSVRSHDGLIAGFVSNPGIYYDSSYWYMLLPHIRFALPDAHLLLLHIYNQTSATNGGYTNIVALKYNLDGILKDIHLLGTYGYYRRVDNEERKDGSLYWQCAITYTNLHITLNNPSAVDIVQRKIKETEIQPGHKDTTYTTVRHLGTRRSRISLD